MKTIYVLYSSLAAWKHEEYINEIGLALKNEYSLVLKKIDTPGELFDLKSEITPEKCQLILSLDMAGFAAKTTGNLPVINQFLMNIVVCIFQPVELFEVYLKNNMSFTTSFLFSSQKDFQMAKNKFPHIWHMDWCSSIQGELPGYLKKIEWRF